MSPVHNPETMVRTTASPTRHRAIGKLMAEAIHQHLWQGSVALEQGHHLTVRIGSGMATYHRFEPKARAHRINLGLGMIRAKQCPTQCAAWLSTREIRQRRYFDGQISTANLLAHTCCHEFAHLLQSVRGERKRGSVHNRAFYRLLDGLHDEGSADRLRCWLIREARQQGLALSTESVDLPALTAGPAPHDFAPGEYVWFWHRQTRHTGRILRVNRHTCSVLGIGVSSGLRFRVPPHLLNSFERPSAGSQA